MNTTPKYLTTREAFVCKHCGQRRTITARAPMSSTLTFGCKVQPAGIHTWKETTR